MGNFIYLKTFQNNHGHYLIYYYETCKHVKHVGYLFTMNELPSGGGWGTCIYSVLRDTIWHVLGISPVYVNMSILVNLQADPIQMDLGLNARFCNIGSYHIIALGAIPDIAKI